VCPWRASSNILECIQKTAFRIYNYDREIIKIRVQIKIEHHIILFAVHKDFMSSSSMAPPHVSRGLRWKLSLLLPLLYYVVAEKVLPSHAMEDVDQDGEMDPNELSDLRKKLYRTFDVDKSGGLEKEEMQSVGMKNKDVNTYLMLRFVSRC
jgi:hypothetical protein